MSADVCIVYFGLRYEIAENEIDRLEEQSDPRVIAARKVGLRAYSGNFSDQSPRYLLFIGKEITKLGPENNLEFSYDKVELASVIDKTILQLEESGLKGNPKLYIQWESDT